METLQKYGFKGSYLSKNWLRQPIFIQSFAPTSLVYIVNKTDLPKILLIDNVDIPTQDTNQSYWKITSDEYLNYIKQYVVGIGPWKDTLVPVAKNYMLTPTNLVSRAHAHNLQVAPKPNTFMPFGSGVHAYPGNELAKLETLIMIHHLVTKFR
ncbi:hypothetical protein VNO80_06614 [Phaseolus coccineus]|uniref:glycerophosphodiester phosphodiesterase n=1 Tax=Phaseolus coccineus TaxID=3886 RepID=A0AAN9NH57_PHACN